jgi:hypothetical protein
MSGYSGTPLWKKLGYKDRVLAYIDGAPATYLADLGLPAEVTVRWSKRPIPGLSFAHLFVSWRTALDSKLTTLRTMVEPSGIVWVSWPKKSSGVATDITEDTVRKVALPLGFVDVKVCAVDTVWSGLKLVIRKELR